MTLAADGIHWSSHDLLTRRAMWNYAIGGRGVGKTYDAKRSRIKHFLKTGKQFIYLRRYDSEFEDKAEFMADLADEFPDYEFKVEGMRVYLRKPPKNSKVKIAWRCFCFFVALSKTVGKKSVPYPNVDYIVFDEFIIEKRCIHYMKNEVKLFLDFYNTVDRFQDRVRVLFLANAVSIVNPYFVYFGLKPRKGVRFCSAMEGYHCCEMIESAAYVERVSKTRFGRMIANTEYFDYAVDNRFTADESQFIAPKTSEARYCWAVVFDGMQLAFWMDYGQNRYYVCEKVPKGGRRYIVTKADQSPDMLMVERSSPLLRGVKKMYMIGGVYFATPHVMAAFFDLLDYLNLR